MSWHAHTTVATVVERDGRFLLVEEMDAGRRVFNQPAGHLDPGETLFAAALRETLEETAWHVELEAFLGVYFYTSPHNEVTYLRHCFLARPLTEVPDRRLDEGILAAHWLSPEEVRRPDFPARSPLVRRVLEDALSGRRFPLDLIHHEDPEA